MVRTFVEQSLRGLVLDSYYPVDSCANTRRRAQTAHACGLSLLCALFDVGHISATDVYTSDVCVWAQ